MSLDRQPPPPLEPLVSEQDAKYPIESLPPIARDAAKAIADHVQAPLNLTAPIVLSAMTSIAQGRINAPSSDNPDGQPCSLFFLTLADSGDGKSRCRKLAFKPLDEKEKAQYSDYKKKLEEYQESCKALKGEALDDYLASHSEPKDPTTTINDATYEAIISRLVKESLIINWDTDEGGIVLCGQSMTGDNKKTVLGGLTKAFDDGSVDRTRSRSNADGSGRAYNRRLSMMLTTQEIVVRKALEDPINRQQGLLPRFILTNAPSLAGTRYISVESIKKRPEHNPAITTYWNKCLELINTSLAINEVENEIQPNVMPMDDEAIDIQITFHNLIESELGRLGDYEEVKHFGNRSVQLAIRLATVMAFFEGKQVIDHQSMANACKLAKYSLDQWSGYGKPSGQKQIELDAVALMEWLTDSKRGKDWRTFSLARLSKDTRNGVKKATRFKPALSYLTKKNYLFLDDDKNYTVNPLALEDAGSAGNTGNNGFTGLQVPRDNRQPTGEIASNPASGAIRKDDRENNPDNTGVPAVPVVPATPSPICDDNSDLDGGGKGFKQCI